MNYTDEQIEQMARAGAAASHSVFCRGDMMDCTRFVLRMHAEGRTINYSYAFTAAVLAKAAEFTLPAPATAPVTSPATAAGVEALELAKQIRRMNEAPLPQHEDECRKVDVAMCGLAVRLSDALLGTASTKEPSNV